MERLVATAREIGADEGVNLDVLLPAAWLHDCMVVPKDSDSRFVIDHFFAKLLTLADSMNTPAGRVKAEKPTDFLRRYLAELEEELTR